MPNAIWNRICKNALTVGITVDYLKDPDRAALTCFWCIKDSSP
jgi:hypothetical protein